MKGAEFQNNLLDLRDWISLLYAASYASGASITAILNCGKRKPTSKIKVGRDILIKVFAQIFPSVPIEIRVYWLCRELRLSRQAIMAIAAKDAIAGCSIAVDFYYRKRREMSDQMIIDVLKR